MLSDCEMERGRGGGEGRCPYGVGEADSMLCVQTCCIQQERDLLHVYFVRARAIDKVCQLINHMMEMEEKKKKNKKKKVKVH